MEQAQTVKSKGGNLTPFVKGDPRINRKGRKKETEVVKKKKRAVKILINEYVKDLAQALPTISPVLIKKAEEGDVVAIKEVHDRVLGRPLQKTESKVHLKVSRITIKIQK